MLSKKKALYFVFAQKPPLKTKKRLMFFFFLPIKRLSRAISRGENNE